MEPPPGSSCPPAEGAGWTETTVVVWQCQTCNRDCVGVGPASRCMCNHRLSEHKLKGGRYVCAVPRCPCRRFFYHVTTGSWNCRCRCKHKHTDHDCSKPPYRCTKRGCGCTGFDSPFVCNCDHGWCDHKTVLKRKRVQTMQGRIALATGEHGGIETMADVQRGREYHEADFAAQQRQQHHQQQQQEEQQRAAKRRTRPPAAGAGAGMPDPRAEGGMSDWVARMGSLHGGAEPEADLPSPELPEELEQQQPLQQPAAAAHGYGRGGYEQGRGYEDHQRGYDQRGEYDQGGYGQQGYADQGYAGAGYGHGNADRSGGGGGGGWGGGAAPQYSAAPAPAPAPWPQPAPGAGHGQQEIAEEIIEANEPAAAEWGAAEAPPRVLGGAMPMRSVHSRGRTPSDESKLRLLSGLRQRRPSRSRARPGSVGRQGVGPGGATGGARYS